MRVWQTCLVSVLSIETAQTPPGAYGLKDQPAVEATRAQAFLRVLLDKPTRLKTLRRAGANVSDLLELPGFKLSLGDQSAVATV
jgi:hypothetical protein